MSFKLAAKHRSTIIYPVQLTNFISFYHKYIISLLHLLLDVLIRLNVILAGTHKEERINTYTHGGKASSFDQTLLEFTSKKLSIL